MVALIVLAVVWSAACAMLGWAQVERLRRSAPGDLRAIAVRLKQAPLDERGRALAQTSSADSGLGRLASAWLSASDERARLAAVNDAIGDIEHALDLGRSWPAAAVRIAAFGAMLLAAVAFLVAGTRALLVVALIGAAAVALSALAARRAGELAKVQREGFDAVVEALVGARLGRDVEGRPASRARASIPSTRSRRRRS